MSLHSSRGSAPRTIGAQIALRPRGGGNQLIRPVDQSPGPPSKSCEAARKVGSAVHPRQQISSLGADQNMDATTAEAAYADAQERDLDPADFEDDGSDELLKVSPALKILTSLGIMAAGYNVTLLVIWVAATLSLIHI